MTGTRHRRGLARRTVAEAVGTFFLVLVGPGAMMVDALTGGVVTHVGVALAFGVVVAAMIYAFGPVSGAHINPAVTVALWSAGRFPARSVAPYIAAQSIGAAAASFLLATGLETSARFGATVPSVPLVPAFCIEWLLAFLLMLAIMAASSDRAAARSAPVVIGATVGVCALVGGPLTGASMNPARSFGPALFGNAWEAHWLYWVAPVAGMAVAARLYPSLSGRPGTASASYDPAGRAGAGDGEVPEDMPVRSPG